MAIPGLPISASYPMLPFAAMVGRNRSYNVAQVVHKLDEFGIWVKILYQFLPQTQWCAPRRWGRSWFFLIAKRSFRGASETLTKENFVRRWLPIGRKNNGGSQKWSTFALLGLLPTFAELGPGIKPEKETDGNIIFLPTLLGNASAEAHDYLYWDSWARRIKQAIRQGTGKIKLAGFWGRAKPIFGGSMISAGSQVKSTNLAGQKTQR